jgi:hypothetical protein
MQDLEKALKNLLPMIDICGGLQYNTKKYDISIKEICYEEGGIKVEKGH